MTDYSTLQADIADWSVRDDLSASIPSFIRIAEAMINREIRVIEMETDIALSVTAANGYAEDLPAGFLGFRSLYNADARNPRMTYVEPDRFHVINNSPNDAFSSGNSAETPYTIESGKVKLDAAAGATDTITLNGVYFKRLDALSDSNTTNAVLQAHYDLYLYGSLIALWDFCDELEMEAKYTKKFDRVVASMDQSEKMRRKAAGPNIRRPPDMRVR
jgi:hypothetical protein